MTNQFSTKVSQVLAFSREEATRLASRSVGPEHLLLGILREQNDTVSGLFREMQVDLPAVKEAGKAPELVCDRPFAFLVRTVDRLTLLEGVFSGR